MRQWSRRKPRTARAQQRIVIAELAAAEHSHGAQVIADVSTLDPEIVAELGRLDNDVPQDGEASATLDTGTGA